MYTWNESNLNFAPISWNMLYFDQNYLIIMYNSINWNVDDDMFNNIPEWCDAIYNFILITSPHSVLKYNLYSINHVSGIFWL